VAKLGGYNASLGVDFSPPYDPQTFLALAAQTPIAPERCFNCYSLRLKAAARAAKEKGVKYFSTTLLFSRQQNQELIIKAGREAELPGVTFYEEDFRLGWKKGRAAAKDLGLYAQKYCGCVYGAVETG
jgi:predicted adenine nucleotide alpha hydrolase (AANH) superfamily ATPase